MKLLSVSDLHGQSVWKEIDVDSYDRIVFLGDYTDSYVLDDDTIFFNLVNIIRLKQDNPAKVILLLGNHDVQYIHYPGYRCSGFRSLAQPMLSELFGEHVNLFQVAYQQGAYLFTHAGVTNKWLARLLVRVGEQKDSITPNYDLAGLLNDVHRQSSRFRNMLFEVGHHRGGSDPFGGIVWADRSETKNDYLTGFHQVVGHTPIDDFTTFGDENGSITYTDVLQTRIAFYEITIPD